MTPLIYEGLTLAMYGMGTVFVFLTMLVLATMLMSWLAGADAKAPTAVIAATPASSASSVNARKLAAISAAIHQHRNRHA